jgi:cobalt-zinc-cadmium efflux system outer membrane protein
MAFIISLSIIAVPIGFGGEIGTESLTLDDVLKIAYINHPRMQQARQEIEAAKGRWIQSEALPDPEVGLEIGGLKKHAKDGGDKQIRDANVDIVSVEQPLDPLGTRFLRGRIAWDGVKIAKGDLELIWARVRQEVIGLYATILTNEKALEIAKENLTATRLFFSRVETRHQAGNALQSDVIRARIEVSRAENELLVSEMTLRVSNGRMNLALGRTVETPLQLRDALSYESLHYQYAQIMKQALEKRADLHNESIRLKARQKGVWSALLKVILPRMGIGIGRTTTDYDNDTEILLKASYPLWGFNFGEVKAAKAEKEKQQIVLESLKREVGLEVYETFLGAELSDKQVALQKKALDEANELLRQITVQYETGGVPFLIYLENLKTIKETRLFYFTALKDYKEKVAELERVIQATPIPEGVKS